MLITMSIFTESFNRGVHHGASLGRLGYGAEISDSFSACVFDLANDLTRWSVGLILAIERNPWVVDYNFRPISGHQLCDFAADSAAGAGHKRHFVFKHFFHTSGSLRFVPKRTLRQISIT